MDFDRPSPNDKVKNSKSMGVAAAARKPKMMADHPVQPSRAKTGVKEAPKPALEEDDDDDVPFESQNGESEAGYDPEERMPVIAMNIEKAGGEKPQRKSNISSDKKNSNNLQLPMSEKK